MMAWLLWARYLVLALLTGLVASFVWMQRSDEGER
jgi:hypothetical protein